VFSFLKYTTTGCKVTALEFQYALWTSSAEQHEKFSAKSERSLPDILSEIRDGNVKYEQWKKVEMADGKKRTKIVDREVTRDSFIWLMPCFDVSDRDIYFYLNVWSGIYA
jgi:hypothetical protein